MLPKEFNLDNLDNGIRGLVITLNRITEINKKTTIYGPTSCEGHIGEYKNGNPYSTKDGWIFFYKPAKKRKDLIGRINQFCIEFPYFSISDREMEEFDFLRAGLNPDQTEKFSSYEIIGSFWSDTGYMDNFRFLEEDARLIEKARIRKKELVSGWNELDSRIKDYIAKNIKKDIESLPYMEEKNRTKGFVIPVCPRCMFQ